MPPAITKQIEVAFTLHPCQRQVWEHPARFRVLASGRRWGKTVLGAIVCLEAAAAGGRAWWVWPSYKVGRIGWRWMKRLGLQIPGAEAREVERIVRLPSGGEMGIRSADEPDSLRGEDLDSLVIDECAMIAEAAWTEVLRATLTDRCGRALFISTPKGMNWFWRAFLRGQDREHDDWKSWSFPTTANPHIARDEVEAARMLLPERVFQQEYEAVFLEEAGGVFRKVRAAVDVGRKENEPPRPGESYRLGVDLARVQDWTVVDVFDASGRQVYHERFNQITWERQSEAIKRTAAAYNQAPVLLDSTGVGDPIYERLRDMGVNVTGYQFTNASKERLINGLALGIEQGDAHLMDIDEQTAELLAFQYELTPSRNVKMGAPEGMHDDCVIGLALAFHPAAGAWEFYSS